MKRPRLVFRVDAGKVLGLSFGHLYRCLALERQLRGRCDCSFVMADYPEGVQVAVSTGSNVQTVSIGDDEAALHCCRQADIVVCDQPKPAEQLVVALNAQGVVTVVLDDNGNKPVSAALLVNGSCVEEYLQYPQSMVPQMRLLGPQYCILGEEFDTALASRLPVAGREPKLVLFMGGSDPTGMTVKIIDALASIGCRLPLTVALGAGFGAAEEVEHRLSRYKGEYCCIVSPGSIADLLAQADLALLAAGRTAYEAAAMGVPAILLPSIAHEELTAGAFEAAGVHCRIAGAWRLEPDVLRGALQKVLLKFVNAPVQLVQMSKQGRALLDGKGCQRVAEAIRSLCLP